MLKAWRYFSVNSWQINARKESIISFDQNKDHMKIEIWSDVACPYCYMGKRKFDMALAQFSGKEDVQIEWKTFLLNPELKTDPNVSIFQYLAEIKGFPEEQAQQMMTQITESGKAIGLDYHFDQVVLANTTKAHQLLHEARVQGFQHEMEERLFEAYFVEGKNTDDVNILVELATEVGMNATALDVKILGGHHSTELEADLELAQQFGVRGVPFFVFDRKYAVSGAQEPETFLKTMEQVLSEK
jgi:predicted DsbA family dithiol-disulfide isomerase